MAVGLTTAVANAVLDATYDNAGPMDAMYVQLHTGDPGAAGSANVANTTRVLGTPSAASAGSLTITAQWAVWAGGADTITHWSGWTASSGGTFLRSGTITSQAVVDGAQVDVTLTLTAGPIAS